MNSDQLSRSLGVTPWVPIFLLASPIVYSICVRAGINMAPHIGSPVVQNILGWVVMMCGIGSASTLLALPAVLLIKKSPWFIAFLLTSSAALTSIPEIAIALRVSYFGVVVRQSIWLAIFFVFCLAASEMTQRFLLRSRCYR
jgi:hypothetical protein